MSTNFIIFLTYYVLRKTTEVSLYHTSRIYYKPHMYIHAEIGKIHASQSPDFATTRIKFAALYCKSASVSV